MHRAEAFKYLPEYFHEVDKFGFPVYIQHYGALNAAALRKVISAENELNSLVVGAEGGLVFTHLARAFY